MHAVSNLMLLCPECHKLVDDHADEYTAAVLRRHKKAHEDRVFMLTATHPDRHTVALVFTARIGGRIVSVSLPEMQQAVAPRYMGPHDLRAVEDDQQTLVRTEAAALQIRQEILADSRVLRRAVPQAERVLLAVGGDAERHNEAVVADGHAVHEQADQVERLERGGLPRRQLGRPTKRRLTARLLVPRLRIVAGTGSRLRAYRRVATPTSLCSTTRRFNGSTSAIAWNVGSGTSRPSARTRGRRTATLRPPNTTSLLTVPAREAWRSASWA